MDQNTVVLEISSDEEVDWNDRGERGITDGCDDHNWLADLLDEVNKENFGEDDGGDDSEEVVLVSEVSPSEKTGKKLKLKSSMIDLDDDCVVLDNDPDKPVEIRNDNPSNGSDDSDDLLVVSEKGQVACRDYPHPRHLCIKFPFSTTPNASRCDQCYCYVCDSLAPCVYWGNGSASTDHCHATDKDEFWRLERRNSKNGSKVIQHIPTVTDASLPNGLPPIDLVRPAPALVQSHSQIPRPSSTHARQTSANVGVPNITNQNRIPVFASRNKFHPHLVSQILLRTNRARGQGHHNHNPSPQLHRPIFKRTGAVGVALTANRYSHRGNFGNPSRQQSYHVNEMLSGPNYPSSYPPHSQNYASSTINPLPDQPLPHQTINPLPDQPLPYQHQFSNQSNPNFPSQVLNPYPENSVLYQPHLVPSFSQPQLAPCQPSYTVPSQSSYAGPCQARVDSPSTPVSDYSQTFPPQGHQAHSSIMDPRFKDYGISWPPSHTLEGGAPTNEASPAPASGGLADFRYDNWIFDNQPVEPGFVDVAGPYGLNEFSADSLFIDTGPIFDF